MSQRPNSDRQWQSLTVRLHSVQSHWDLALAEAGRRFSAAADQPFDDAAVQAMAAAAVRRTGSWQPVGEAWWTQLHFVADTSPWAQAGDRLTERDAWWYCVGALVGSVAEGVTTEVNSILIDCSDHTRSRLTNAAAPLAPNETMVLDVSARCDRLAARLLDRLRAATIRSDTRWDSKDWDDGQETLSYIAALDYAECDDEVVQAYKCN